MGATGMTEMAIAALALLWVAISAAIAVIAARRFRLAQQVIAAAQANARLIEIMPCRPLLVRADRSIEIDEPLRRDLGINRGVSGLSELAGQDSGLLPEDLTALERDIATAQASATQGQPYGPIQRFFAGVRSAWRSRAR